MNAWFHTFVSNTVFQIPPPAPPSEFSLLQAEHPAIPIPCVMLQVLKLIWLSASVYVFFFLDVTSEIYAELTIYQNVYHFYIKIIDHIDKLQWVVLG